MTRRRSIFSQIRWQLLIVLILIVLIPLAIVVVFSTHRTFINLAQQSQQFYSSLLSQTSGNVGFIYNQYGRTASSMIDLPVTATQLFRPPYQSGEDERLAGKQITGDAGSKDGMYVQASALEGKVFMYELDRKSILNGTDYKIHSVSSTNLPPSVDTVTKSNAFKTVMNEESNRMILASLYDCEPGHQAKSVLDLGEDYHPIIIYPYSHEGVINKNKFILIELFPKLIKDTFINLDKLNFGTLYILDQFDNVISRNHPDSDIDFYTYNESTGRYILEKDDSHEAFYGMTFKDYENLLTDEKILNTNKIKSILEKLTFDNVQEMRENLYEKNSDPNNVLKNINYITHNNKKYMVIVGFNDETKCKFIYFHPLAQIYKPIYNTVFVIIVIALFVFALVVILSTILSKTLTEPISELSEASTKVAEGDYNINLNIKASDELMMLQDNFSQMASKIKNYTENLEKMVSDRTVELKTAHDQLAKAHKALWSEMELAKKLQISLLPKTSLPNYDVAARMMTADEVGGDFYDFMHYGSKNAVMIGDVSGHGVTPGLITMIAQASISSLTLQNENITLSKLFTYLNKILVNSLKNLGINIFVTISLLQEVRDGVFKGVGKHNDIIIYRAKTETIEVIPTDGVWLCVVDDVEPFIKEYEFTLEKDDVMLLYTDGLSEGVNKDEVCFDSQIQPCLKKYAKLPANEILNNILTEYAEFIETQDDDVTLLVIKK